MPSEFSPWIPNGFQTNRIRRPRKNVPGWATERNLRYRIFGAALRRYRIAHLYWLCGWNSREVAEELGVDVQTVKNTIFNLAHGGSNANKDTQEQES